MPAVIICRENVDDLPTDLASVRDVYKGLWDIVDML
jgi:hypothetical protein